MNKSKTMNKPNFNNPNDALPSGPSTPSIVISRVNKHHHIAETDPANGKCLTPGVFSGSKAFLLGSSPSNYNESLMMLSQSLEQICGKGLNDSSSSLNKDSPPSSLSSKPESCSYRPRSINLGSCINNSNANSALQNVSNKEDVSDYIIRVRHEETGVKLEQSLSKICSPKPTIGLKKKLSDAQESLKAKFRLKIDTSKYKNEPYSNFYISIDNARMIKICHQPSQDVTPTQETLNEPITTVLHSSTIPEFIEINKLLCSSQPNSFLYLRPSSTINVHYKNTKHHFVPIIYSDEKNLKFSISVKIPSEIALENIDLKRIDELLLIRGVGFCKNTSMESTLKLEIELPEDSDGRTVTAKVNQYRILIIDGLMLPASRRMTCRF